MSNEDLECVGCGCKLGCLKKDECGYVEWAKHENKIIEQQEREQLARLKAKYET